MIFIPCNDVINRKMWAGFERKWSLNYEVTVRYVLFNSAISNMAAKMCFQFQLLYYAL